MEEDATRKMEVQVAHEEEGEVAYPIVNCEEAEADVEEVVEASGVVGKSPCG
jgi:hypothetical protein